MQEVQEAQEIQLSPVDSEDNGQLTMLKELPAGEVESQEDADGMYEKSKVYILNIKDINVNPDQPRKHFDPNSLDDLTRSINNQGIIMPILVTRKDRKIYIVAGERRYRAAQKLGLPTIPSIFVDGNTEVIALIENIQRENLSSVDEAEAMERMMNIYHYRQDDLAFILGKSTTTISETLSIVKIPEEIRNNCKKNKDFSKRILVKMARLKSKQAMMDAYDKIIARSTPSEKKDDNKQVGEQIAQFCIQIQNFKTTLNKKLELYKKEGNHKNEGLTEILQGLQITIEGFLSPKEISTDKVVGPVQAVADQHSVCKQSKRSFLEVFGFKR